MKKEESYQMNFIRVDYVCMKYNLNQHIRLSNHTIEYKGLKPTIMGKDDFINDDRNFLLWGL